MPSRRNGARRAAAHCRRATRSRLRGTRVVRQEGQSSAEGPDDSPKAAKAVKAQKARKA